MMSLKGLDGLKRAIARNPSKVKDEAREFLTDAMAEYKRGIIRDPWRVGGNGGGAPVDTMNMRDTHQTTIEGLRAAIGPDLRAAPYAEYVIMGTKHMKARPYLDYVQEQKSESVNKLAEAMLEAITNDLAK